MILYNNSQFKILSSGINSLANNNKLPLVDAGIPHNIIHNIASILHNYSFVDFYFLHDVFVPLLQSHSPEKGILRFERFLENSEQNQIELNPYHSEFPSILAAIFSTSSALSERLNSDNAVISQLRELKNPLLPQSDKNYYMKNIQKIIKDSESLSERSKVKAIHIQHTVQLMRICARNANPAVNIAEITAELSSLADAVVESCLKIAAEDTFSAFKNSTNQTKIPHEPSLFVLGLGKLGGGELNVSSDIDIIYLCDEKEGWPSFEDMNLHTFLAERLTKLLSEATESGYLYRVDTRLRADGLSGPLVRTTGDYFRYLEMRGEAWERQMLLKARPIAGKIEAGQAFLDSLERFIYPTSITKSPNREIFALKNQIEARISAEGSKKTHLKLMPGGIRDIEFIVQCLQLLMGGKHPEVRCTGTLRAIAMLKDAGALSDEEYSTLSVAYSVYRSVENALQWRELLPAFNIPDSSEEMNELAAYLDIPGLPGELERLFGEVRSLYNEIFTLESSESFEEMAIRSAINPAGDEKVKRFLENLGFNNPDKSAKDLSMLVFGKSSGKTELNLHPSIERFLPKLLKALSDLPDPGGALEHFNHIADSYNAHSVLFDIMENNQQFFNLLLSITQGSVFIKDILVRDPSLLDWLVETGELLHSIDKKALLDELKMYDSEISDDTAFTRECLKVKLREKLRIGTRDITGLSTSDQTFTELTCVAECILKAVYLRAFRKVSSELHALKDNFSFSVIGAGKLGSSMMDFGSDLDLIFVYESSGEYVENIKVNEYSIKLAQHILFLISGGGGADKIYDIDARLRPEGGNSPLAVSIEEYRKYLERRASVWERLALVRARHLTGEKKLGNEVTEALRDFVYRGHFTHPEITEILNMRKTIAYNSAKKHKGLINIKSGHGGIIDIDFIAQSYTAHFCKEYPEIRFQNTLNILNALASKKILTQHDVSSLKELYNFLCSVEKAIRIGSGNPVNTLPESSIELARIARLMKFKNIRRFNKRLQDVISLTRELYDRLMQELLEAAGGGKK